MNNQRPRKLEALYTQGKAAFFKDKAISSSLLGGRVVKMFIS
jgi:hypothetical protein